MDPTLVPSRPVVLVGAEAAGKSTLAATLAGVRPRADNVAGSTVASQAFRAADRTYVDTPGLLHRADTAATRLALEALADESHDALLVLRATSLDEDLAELLPLIAGRAGAVAVTQWDRVTDTPAARTAVASIAVAVSVPFVVLDAREPGGAAEELRWALDAGGRFTTGPVLARAGWRIEPPPTVLDHPRWGPPLGLATLLAPAVASVWLAVTVADALEPVVESLLEPVGGCSTISPVSTGPWRPGRTPMRAQMTSSKRGANGAITTSSAPVMSTVRWPRARCSRTRRMPSGNDLSSNSCDSSSCASASSCSSGAPS